MRHEHYGLHKYSASHREIETSSELVIIQRGRCARSLQSLIAIDRSELQLDWAQSGAIQALKSMLTFRQKIIRRGGLYKSTRIILSRIIHDIEIRSHKIHSRLKSRAPGSLSKPVWVLAISLSLSSRLPPSLSLSLSTCIPRQVRGRAASTCIPIYPVDLIPPLYYFVRSLGYLAFPRTSSPARLFARERVFGAELCHTTSRPPVPDIALSIRSSFLWYFRGNLGHEKRGTNVARCQFYTCDHWYLREEQIIGLKCEHRQSRSVTCGLK